MKRNLLFLTLVLTLAASLAACSPNVPETASPTPMATATHTPAVTSTPEGILDDIGEAGEDLADGIGDAAKDVTDGVKKALR